MSGSSVTGVAVVWGLGQGHVSLDVAHPWEFSGQTVGEWHSDPVTTLTCVMERGEKIPPVGQIVKIRGREYIVTKTEGRTVTLEEGKA